jgi:hypothetical protein
VHPAVIDAYMEAGLPEPARGGGKWLRPDEAAALAFLRARLGTKKRRRPAHAVTAKAA